MQRLDLEATGKRFIWAMRTCLEWLALGGDIKLASGHTIVMCNKARPGFLMDHYDSKTKETTQMVMNLDYDLVWGYIVDYARKMTEDEITVMCANLALNNAREM